MKPWETLDRTRLPDGTELALRRHPDELVIAADGRTLMSSRTHGSEEALARLGCQQARTLTRPAVLIGGLGMGFTLRATLDLLPPDATVVVAELVPAIVDWNRGPLGPLAGYPLKDRRVARRAAVVIPAARRPRCERDLETRAGEIDKPAALPVKELDRASPIALVARLFQLGVHHYSTR